MNDKLNDFIFGDVTCEDIWEEALASGRKAVYDNIDKLGFALAGRVSRDKYFMVVRDNNHHNKFTEYVNGRYAKLIGDMGNFDHKYDVLIIILDFVVPKDIFQLGRQSTFIFVKEMMLTFKKYNLDIELYDYKKITQCVDEWNLCL